MPVPSHGSPTATHLDVERLLGPLDTETAMAIMALSPSLQEVEKASLHVGGEAEAFASLSKHACTWARTAIVTAVMACRSFHAEEQSLRKPLNPL